MSTFLLFIKKPQTIIALVLLSAVLFFIATYKSNSSKIAELEYKEEVRIEVDKIEKQQDVVQEEIIDRKKEMVQFEKELPKQIDKEIQDVKKDDASYFITADDANNSLQ